MRVFIGFLLCFSSMFLQAQDIFDAARSGDTAQVKALIAQTPGLVNSINASGYSPLIIAAYNNQPWAVSILLSNKANVDFRDKMGNSALIGVCFKGYTKIGEELIKNGADVNLANYNNATPLIFAATFGNVDMIRLLLEHKALKDVKDTNGNTAMDHAVIQGNDRAIEALK